MSRSGQAYQRLDSYTPSVTNGSSTNNLGIPSSSPPLYDDLAEDSPQADQFQFPETLPSHGIEQFEIEDMFEEDYGDETRVSDGWVTRASLMTKKLANNFNNKIIHPVTMMIDPIYEGYRYFHSQYEQTILKLGNPLVVKRLFYLFFVIVILFFVGRYEVTDAVDGTSGGGFSSGKFYSIDKLSNSIRSYVDPNSMKMNLEYLSSMPHIAGSKGDLTLAKYVQTYMDNNGLRRLEFNEIQSFLNYPSKKDTYVKLADGSFEAKLYEDNDNSMEYLSYNPNSMNTDGEIEGRYVYLNEGSPLDFKKLKDANIDVKDCILLVKYGGAIPEANKVKLAENLQAKAIIFISPKVEIIDKDGKSHSHDDIIQKVNVALTRVSPGDILTPGWSDVKGFVARIPWGKSSTTPKIPTIPISYENGQQLLSKLNKEGINFGDDNEYSGKPDSSGSNIIKMKITNTQRQTNNIWNVIGSIEGREQSNKGIVIGASRDSSCYGTLSTNSGTVVLLEMIKVFTSLQRLYNWSPARSIYFVSFDGSEYNMAGSTEWIESRKDSLKKEGYAYIDLSDVITGDDLSVKAHPFLHSVIKDSLKKVKSDRTRRADDLEERDDSRLDLYQVFMQSNKGSEDISYSLTDQKNYLSFINLVNIPSLEIKFTGKEYAKHSCRDTFTNWENSNIDNSMLKHEQLVELLSIIALNMAEEPAIPYNFLDLADHLSKYVKDLESYSHEIIDSLTQRNIPRINFDPLVKAISILRDSGGRYHDWLSSWKEYLIESSDIEPSITALDRWRWNERMVEFNAAFINVNSRPERIGYVNFLFGAPYSAPEDSTRDGYDWNTFPAIRDALHQNDWNKVKQEIMIAANMIASSAEKFVQY